MTIVFSVSWNRPVCASNNKWYGAHLLWQSSFRRVLFFRTIWFAGKKLLRCNNQQSGIKPNQTWVVHTTLEVAYHRRFWSMHVNWRWAFCILGQLCLICHIFGKELNNANLIESRHITVNSIYCGHCRDLELVSSLARVRNSEGLFQSNVCNLFLPGI